MEGTEQADILAKNTSIAELAKKNEVNTKKR